MTSKSYGRSRIGLSCVYDYGLDIRLGGRRLLRIHPDRCLRPIADITRTVRSTNSNYNLTSLSISIYIGVKTLIAIGKLHRHRLAHDMIGEVIIENLVTVRFVG